MAQSAGSWQLLASRCPGEQHAQPTLGAKIGHWAHPVARPSANQNYALSTPHTPSRRCPCAKRTHTAPLSPEYSLKRLYSAATMSSGVTGGVIARINNGEKPEGVRVQVVDIKKIQAAQPNNQQDRYRCALAARPHSRAAAHHGRAVVQAWHRLPAAARPRGR